MGNLGSSPDPFDRGERFVRLDEVPERSETPDPPSVVAARREAEEEEEEEPSENSVWTARGNVSLILDSALVFPRVEVTCGQDENNFVSVQASGCALEQTLDGPEARVLVCRRSTKNPTTALIRVVVSSRANRPTIRVTAAGADVDVRDVALTELRVACASLVMRGSCDIDTVDVVATVRVENDTSLKTKTMEVAGAKLVRLAGVTLGAHASIGSCEQVLLTLTHDVAVLGVAPKNFTRWGTQHTHTPKDKPSVSFAGCQKVLLSTPLS